MARAKFPAFLFLLCTAFSAHAGILFEPMAGYSVGSSSVKYVPSYDADPSMAGKTDSSSLNGISYGGRVGFTFNGFAVLAAEYQAIDAKERRNSTTTQYDWKARTLFATMGFQAPNGFRLLGSYGWDAKAEQNTTPYKTQFKGTAAKLLLGWHLPTNIAINLEYSIYHYTDMTVNNVTSKLNKSFDKFDTSSAMATISFPFEFFGSKAGGGGKRSNFP